MRLEDGKLYETKRGWRFRVFEGVDGLFTCSSFSGCWDWMGNAYGKVNCHGKTKKPHLVKEVQETRLISVPFGVDFDVNDGLHHFKRVTKEEAQRRGHESNHFGEDRKASAILARVMDATLAYRSQHTEKHFDKFAQWKSSQNQTLCHDHASKKVGRPAKINGNDVRWVTVEQLKRWRNAMVEGECDYMATYREIRKVLEEPADSID